MLLHSTSPDESSNDTALSNNNQPPTCNTIQCLQVAQLLQNTISRDGDPCEDFYSYVCAGWKAAISQTKQSTVFNLHERNLTAAVMNALEHKTVPVRNQDPFEKAAGLYQACLHLLNDPQDSKGAPEVVLKFLRERNVNFDFTSTIDPVLLFLDLAFSYGIPTLVNVEVQDLLQMKDRRTVVVSLREELARRLPDTVDTAIFNHLAWVGVRKSVQLRTVASAIHNVSEVILSAAKNAFLDDGKGSSDLRVYQLSTLEKVITLRKGDRWNEQMTALSGGILPGQHLVVFKGRKVISFLNIVFKDVDPHELGLWIGYESSLYLKQLIYHGVTEETARERIMPQWKSRCLKLTSRVMHFAVYASYLYQAISPNETEEARTMVTSIADAIARRIQASSWLDRNTKLHALRKLSMMKKNVGYPKEAQSMDVLIEYYKIYPDSEPHFLSSWLRASHAFMRRSIERLMNLSPAIELNRDMALVNAYYQPLLNEIVLPVPLLTPPFFGTVPAVDYGAVGHLSAHEMMHAFDVSSSRRDQYGMAHDWWTPASRREYDNRVQCLRNSLYGPDDRRTSGALTAPSQPPDDTTDSEILSDFIGVSGLYDAYSVQPRTLIEGVQEFDSDQLFFVAFCYKWCSNSRPSPRYPPFKERCNTPLRNTKEFSVAFNCSAEAKMNPPKKCTFW